MKVSELLDLICECLELEAGSITLETEIKSVDEWNSVGWLTIMSAMDERFELQLPSKDIRGFKTAGDVVEYIGTRVELVK